MRGRARLEAVELDAGSLAEPHPLIAAERAAAIRDLVEGETVFLPSGHEHGAFRLRLSIADRRLVLDIAERGRPLVRHALPLAAFSRLIKDYFLVCESFSVAIASAPAARVEALDMGRRSLHDEAAELLRDQLAGRVTLDRETARRLFTLVCALRWRG